MLYSELNEILNKFKWEVSEHNYYTLLGYLRNSGIMKYGAEKTNNEIINGFLTYCKAGEKNRRLLSLLEYLNYNGYLGGLYDNIPPNILIKYRFETKK